MWSWWCAAFTWRRARNNRYHCALAPVEAQLWKTPYRYWCSFIKPPQRRSVRREDVAGQGKLSGSINGEIPVMEEQFGNKRETIVYRSILSADELIQLIQSDYNLPSPVQCWLFQCGVNDIYFVSAQGKKYILRISHTRRYGAFDESAYCFELDLLHYLGQKKSPVSCPLTRNNNDLLGMINAPEGRRYYSLFNFADGEILPALTEEYAYVFGKTLAELHLVMNKFSSPHPRFHLDEEFLINEPVRRLRAFSQISRENISFLERLAESLSSNIKGLTRQPGEYGIIHGDFWWENIHVKEKELTIFDFDFCGYGWLAYDIGCLRGTAKALGTDLSAETVDSFLRGYQSVRKLTELELRAIPAFEKIRVIWALGLWTTFVNVLGVRWFNDSSAQLFSILKKWVDEDPVQPDI
jgi:Ser/Thr protein kinase RdoA (MazF antagonist)